MGTTHIKVAGQWPLSTIYGWVTAIIFGRQTNIVVFIYDLIGVVLSGQRICEDKTGGQ